MNEKRFINRMRCYHTFEEHDCIWQKGLYYLITYKGNLNGTHLLYSQWCSSRSDHSSPRRCKVSELDFPQRFLDNITPPETIAVYPPSLRLFLAAIYCFFVSIDIKFFLSNSRSLQLNQCAYVSNRSHSRYFQCLQFIPRRNDIL